MDPSYVAKTKLENYKEKYKGRAFDQIATANMKDATDILRSWYSLHGQMNLLESPNLKVKNSQAILMLTDLKSHYGNNVGDTSRMLFITAIFNGKVPVINLLAEFLTMKRAKTAIEQQNIAESKRDALIERYYKQDFTEKDTSISVGDTVKIRGNTYSKSELSQYVKGYIRGRPTLVYIPIRGTVYKHGPDDDFKVEELEKLDIPGYVIIANENKRRK